MVSGGEWVVQREVRTHKRLAENLSRLQLLACKEKWRPEHRYGDWVPAKRANLGDDNIKASTPSVGHKHNMPEKQAPHRVSEQNVVVGIPSGQAPHRVDGTLGTHICCLVGVDLAIGESHVAFADVDATSL